MNPLGLILLIVLLVVLFGAWPSWGYSSGWGYGPSSFIGILLIVLVVLIFTGRL